MQLKDEKKFICTLGSPYGFFKSRLTVSSNLWICAMDRANATLKGVRIIPGEL